MAAAGEEGQSSMHETWNLSQLRRRKEGRFYIIQPPRADGSALLH